MTKLSYGNYLIVKTVLNIRMLQVMKTIFISDFGCSISELLPFT
jgi:hypothetical protein